MKPLSYSATNLDDIARFFDGMAKREDEAARRETTKKKIVAHTAAATAYRDCAQVLRSTKLNP